MFTYSQKLLANRMTLEPPANRNYRIGQGSPVSRRFQIRQRLRLRSLADQKPQRVQEFRVIPGLLANAGWQGWR